MPSFSFAALYDPYRSHLANGFQYVGRFHRYGEVRNRLIPSEKLGGLVGEYDSNYAVPQLTHAAVVRNLAKYNKPDIKLAPEHQEAFNWAKSAVVEMFGAIRLGTRVMNLDEVLSSIDLKKSPGFPWNSCGYQSHEQVISEHRDWLENYITDALNGDLPNVVWNAFPKEELRTHEKIAAGKIRHISGCPTEFKLAVDCLLLAQNEAFYDEHDRSFSKVGMTQMYGEWDALARWLTEVCGTNSDCGLEADVKQMDADYQWFVAQAMVDIRFQLFPENMRTQETYYALLRIYQEIYRGLQVTGEGFVFSKTHGNASGSPLTVVDNTLATILMLFFAICLNFRSGTHTCDFIATTEHGFPELSDIMEHVRAAIYGDDTTVFVSKLAKEHGLVSADILTRGAKVLGWDIEFAGSWSTIHDIAFLSRKFSLIGGMFMPEPVESNKYLDSLVLKSRKGETDLQAYERCCGLYLVAYWSSAVRNKLEPILDQLEVDIQRSYPGVIHRVRKSRLSPAQIEYLYRNQLCDGRNVTCYLQPLKPAF